MKITDTPASKEDARAVCNGSRAVPHENKGTYNLIKSPVRIGSPSSGGSGRLAVAPNHVVLHVVTPHSRVTTDGALVWLFPCVTSDVTP